MGFSLMPPETDAKIAAEAALVAAEVARTAAQTAAEVAQAVAAEASRVAKEVALVADDVRLLRQWLVGDIDNKTGIPISGALTRLAVLEERVAQWDEARKWVIGAAASVIIAAITSGAMAILGRLHL